MKKMRRLIPAIAMLLVSAVMLSTASFAWFTMNDNVTASGMQIQAKATGSFVIDTVPLNYASGKTAADITTTNTKLKPMTLNEGKWQIPDSKNSKIDSHTGHFVGTPAWEDLNFTNATTGAATIAEYYVEKELYIGSAGDTLVNQLITVDLKALVAYDDTTTDAYAAALYVVEQTNGNWNKPAKDAVPDKIVYIDANAQRNTVLLDGGSAKQNKGYTVPSIVGVGAQDTDTTGLLIVVRFFVDGALDAITGVDADGNEIKDKKPVADGYKYTVIDTVNTDFSPTGAYYVEKFQYKEFTGDFADDTYYELVDGEYVETEDESRSEGKKYYTLVGGEYEPAVIEGLEDWKTGVVYYKREVNMVDKEYKLVNSDSVPTNGTTLELTISGKTWVDPNASTGN